MSGSSRQTKRTRGRKDKHSYMQEEFDENLFTYPDAKNRWQNLYQKKSFATGRTLNLVDDNKASIEPFLEKMGWTKIVALPDKDLFAAGTDTSSSTVEWAMTELLHNPETLKKAKAELEQTLGKGKLIEEADIARLPYLRAIIKETMRMHPAAPFLIPRKVEGNVEICGFTVPQGAQVLVNAWAIGRDPSIWPNPTSFTPERFSDSEIDVRGKNFELIPFGAGRRICPGLPLAVRIVPVMLGSLINSFDWKLEGGIEPKDLDMEEKFGITLQKAQPLRVVPFHV